MTVDYEEYIQSERWLTSRARLAEIRAARMRCRICNDGPPTVRMEVHHRTYERLGCEDPADLTLLCRACHDLVTEELRRRRHRRRPVGASPDTREMWPGWRLGGSTEERE